MRTRSFFFFFFFFFFLENNFIQSRFQNFTHEIGMKVSSVQMELVSQHTRFATLDSNIHSRAERILGDIGEQSIAHVDEDDVVLLKIFSLGENLSKGLVTLDNEMAGCVDGGERTKNNDLREATKALRVEKNLDVRVGEIFVDFFCGLVQSAV